MNQENIVIEFFKCRSLGDLGVNKNILDCTTIAKVSTKSSSQSIVLITIGYFETIEQQTFNGNSILSAICKINSKAVEEVNDQNHKYRFKVPIHFRWMSDFCLTEDKQILKDIVLLSQQINTPILVESKKHPFSLSAHFDDEIFFETTYCDTDFFLDLDVCGIFSKRVCVENFKGSIKFSNSHFKNFFKMTELQCSSLVFSESIFDNQLKIQKGVFENIVNFYNTKFKLAPILCEVVFKESANFINTKMEFTFYELREQIEEIVRERYPFDAIPFLGSSDIEKDKAKSLYREKISSDFQDTFRLIKNTLIKENNTLEAIKYHRMELYAKEIGLIGVEDRGIVAMVYGDFFRNVERIGKVIDRWQLAFYRHLSDHHTGLLRVFNNFVITNSLFFALLYFLKINFFKYFSSNSVAEYIVSNIQKYFFFPIFFYFFLIFVFYKTKENKTKENKTKENKTKENKTKENKTKENRTKISPCNEVLIFFKNFPYFLFLTFTILIFNRFLCFIFSSSPYLLTTINATSIGFLFLGALLFFITNTSIVARLFLVSFSYIFFFFIIIPILFSVSANVLNLKNLIEENRQDVFCYFVIFLYFFFNVIILWSLQKTARKNSIIPS